MIESSIIPAKIAGEVRDDALRGRNPILSIARAGAEVDNDVVLLQLSVGNVALPKHFKGSMATPRVRQPQLSPVKVWRPGLAA